MVAHGTPRLAPVKRQDAHDARAAHVRAPDVIYVFQYPPDRYNRGTIKSTSAAQHMESLEACIPCDVHRPLCPFTLE